MRIIMLKVAAEYIKDGIPLRETWKALRQVKMLKQPITNPDGRVIIGTNQNGEFLVDDRHYTKRGADSRFGFIGRINPWDTDNIITHDNGVTHQTWRTCPTCD